MVRNTNITRNDINAGNGRDKHKNYQSFPGKKQKEKHTNVLIFTGWIHQEEFEEERKDKNVKSS